MKVLVTGAAGFIGGELVKRLRSEGNDVTGWDDFSAASNNPGGVLNREAVAYMILHDIDPNEFDVIYNLACNTQAMSHIMPVADMDVNAHAVRVLAEGFKGHFVQASSVSVYGVGECRENKPTNPESYYGVSKLAGEGYLKIARSSRPDSYCILRLSNVYGPGQNTKNPNCGVIGQWMDAAVEGKPLKVIPDQYRDFTHISDVLDALVRAGVEKWRGTLNIAYGKAESVERVARTIALKYGVPVQFIAPRAIDIVLARVVYCDMAWSKYLWHAKVPLKTGLEALFDSSGRGVAAA